MNSRRYIYHKAKFDNTIRMSSRFTKHTLVPLVLIDSIDFCSPLIKEDYLSDLIEIYGKVSVN